MPAILTVLIAAAFAIIPPVPAVPIPAVPVPAVPIPVVPVPAVPIPVIPAIPTVVPIPAIPAIPTVVPIPAIPAIPTFVPTPAVPTFVPLPIPAVPTFVPLPIPAVPTFVPLPIPAVPTFVPQPQPDTPIFPAIIVPTPFVAPSPTPFPQNFVPGVVPALVPGFTPGFVAPGTPQPFGPSFAPSTPATILSGSGSGPCYVGTCNPTTGNRRYNGRTLFFTRTCTTCNTRAIGNFATFTVTGCSGLTGNDFNDCCRAGLRDPICDTPSQGRPTTCTCNGVTTACPRCNNSKKGLLGLLGLLGLIPLLLCLSLLSCLLWLCCIRGTKKGPETHFATYSPQAAALPTVVQTCAPEVICAPVATHCDVPYMPAYGVA